MKLSNILFLLLTCIIINSCQSQDKHLCVFSNDINVTHDQCGYIDVADGKTKIAYIIIKSKSNTPKSDPVVFIQGGPGGAVLQLVNNYASLNLDPDRDFILYDQRGIGFSGNICPNISQEFVKVIACM